MEIEELKVLEVEGFVSCVYYDMFILGIITLFIPIFKANIQFSTMVFKKINLVHMFFKMYTNWSFLLSRILRRQRLLMCQTEVALRDIMCQGAVYPRP